MPSIFTNTSHKIESVPWMIHLSSYFLFLHHCTPQYFSTCFFLYTATPYYQTGWWCVWTKRNWFWPHLNLFWCLKSLDGQFYEMLLGRAFSMQQTIFKQLAVKWHLANFKTFKTAITNFNAILKLFGLSLYHASFLCSLLNMCELTTICLCWVASSLVFFPW